MCSIKSAIYLLPFLVAQLPLALSQMTVPTMEKAQVGRNLHTTPHLHEQLPTEKEMHQPITHKDARSRIDNGSISIVKTFSSAVDYPNMHRREQVSSTELAVQNDCVEPVTFNFEYETADGWQLYQELLLNNNEYMVFSGVINPEVYIHGTTPGGVTWTGDFCLDDPPLCFQQMVVESILQESTATIAFTCDGEENSAPGGSQGGNEWLDAHNSRREWLHQEYGVEPVLLKWSDGIAQSAQGYADTLIGLNGCTIEHGVNGDDYGGENLAMNTGSNAASPEEVLTRWFDNESSLPQGSNGHYTQVAWRGTHYVGCAEAQKQDCFIQVCRYITPGNCNMGSDWVGAMLADSSPCDPPCPPEGCF